MGDEEDVRVGMAGRDQVGPGRTDGVEVGGDEPVVQGERHHLVHPEPGRAVSGDVLQVLAAPGVGRVGAGRHRQHAPRAVGGEVGQDVGEVGRPVAVAPHHRDVQSAGVELGPQRRQQGTVLIVDRAASPEQAVVPADDLQPLVGDVAATRHGAQEGDDVLLTLRPPEREEQNGVIAGQR
ncbi:hypothetical protein SDC9_94215 [bioreactor metagenome]|uniref:Uncharacterized protein n=1 Tax=bioreactor metagenome TaxID=1076179 RepID=A0A645ACU8_9ZZZZ